MKNEKKSTDIEMMICAKHNNAQIAVSSCIKRYKKAQEIKKQTHGTFGAADGLYFHCRDCETGKRLLESDSKLDKRGQARIMIPNCPNCGETDPEKFHRDARAFSGRKTICSACTAEIKREKSQKIKKNTNRIIAENIPVVPQTCISLDFSNHPELLININSTAQSEFRTPDQQILYWLNERVVTGHVGAIPCGCPTINGG